MSIHMAFWKESMINRLSKLINRNRSAAKISQVLCSSNFPIQKLILQIFAIINGTLVMNSGKTSQELRMLSSVTL